MDVALSVECQYMSASLQLHDRGAAHAGDTQMTLHASRCVALVVEFGFWIIQQQKNIHLLHWEPHVASCEASSVLQDPEMPLWLSDHAQDFLSKTLLKDPSKRSTAAQLLKHPWLRSLGFKAPADQSPSSVQVVQPVLPPRPVVIPAAVSDAVLEAAPQAASVTEPTVPEEQFVEEETIKAVVPEEAQVAAAGKLQLLFALCAVRPFVMQQIWQALLSKLIPAICHLLKF